MAPGGPLLLVVVVMMVVVLVDAVAAIPMSITTAIFHSHNDNNNNNNNSESNQIKNDLDFFLAAAKKGLRSFTGGRGNYKAMAKEFLEAHNQVRTKYGVPPLRWSKKLARYARRWSSMRRFDCVMMHSVGGPYGENVFWGTGWDWRAVNAVSSWASEASFYDWRAQACHPGQVCEHFTQMVWRTTKYVGCGRAECLAGGVFITCSYDPPGNWKGEVPLT